MFRNTRSFASFILAFVLIAQPLAAMAQDKALKSVGAGASVQNETSVEINRVRIINLQDLVEVSWSVVLPAGVEATGFDVRVDAALSNGTAQTDSKSFGGDARSGTFKFNLPAASDGGPRPGGGGGTGTIGPAGKSVKNEKSSASNSASTTDGGKSGNKTPRKLGEGNITPGGNTNAGNNNSGNNAGNGIRPVRPTPTPKPVIPPIVIPTPKPLPPPAIPPKEKPEAVRITKLKAFITAKFAAGNDLSALSEFIQPTDKVTGEMKLKGARGNALQAKKLIHLNEVARLATECPAGQECFDIIAEVRGAEANGQFKVSAEFIFANGVRRNTTRTVGNLLRPVRLSVDKIAGTQIANVLVTINGGGNREQFIKQDTQALGILAPVSPTKK